MLGKISGLLSKKPRNIFLMDGIGAFLSFILLLLLIARFENIFGLPKHIALALSYPIILFMVYSISCYLINIKKWKPFLLVITVANFLYCCTTAVIMINYFHLLSPWGIAYFMGEIIIILFLIIIEVLVIKKNKT